MKATPVIYLDAKGKEHEALVFAINQMNPGYLSLVYIDESLPEADNVVKQFDVRHMDEVKEPNPALPTYHLNCWKEDYRLSRALPSDHPANDHPHRKTVDEFGAVIPINRPEYDADIAAIAAHRAVSQADGDGAYEPSSEGEPDSAKPEGPNPKYARLAQLEAAVDQGSDALFAKDKQIAELQTTNTILNEQIAQLKAAPSQDAPSPAPADNAADEPTDEQPTATDEAKTESAD